MKIKYLLNNLEKYENKNIKLKGWIRFKRFSNNIGFIELFDGTYLSGIQLVSKFSDSKEIFEKLKLLHLFSGIVIEGKLVKGKNDTYEVIINKVLEIFDSSDDYLLGKKQHGLEFLREISHIRPRTKLFQSIMRIRSNLAINIHIFFNEHNFLYFHSPIITSNDAEGAGETFYIKTSKGEDFFSNPGSLTVSGQLHSESYAQAFSDVYTFGPTFRAEKSNTTKHASEFWMIEPESAFKDYFEMMEISENLLKYLIEKILKENNLELKFLEEFYKKDIINNLNKILKSNFKKMTYTNAIKKLNKEFDKKIKFGDDLSTENEKYLSKSANGPIFIYDYPKEIKSFYMYQNNDKKTVRGFDLLVPDIGELIGGSQREDRIDLLIENAKLKKINLDEIEWYISLRKYGYSKSSGFGIGFERLVMFFTGVDNIRDSIPFPRTPGKLNF